MEKDLIVRDRIISNIRLYFRAILNSYSDILFMSGRTLGMVMLAATLVMPHIAVAGLIAVLAAYGFARFIRMDKAYLSSGFYTYNPLLVGLAIGYLFSITPLTIFFIVCAGIFTFVLTIMLHHIFRTYLQLPILSLPFALVSCMAYLASSQYSSLFANGLTPKTLGVIQLALPFWITGFLKSLGTILVLPNVIPGLILAIALLLTSRILFFLAIAGYYTGTLITGMLTGSYNAAFADINHFNYILIAMAVGGVFLVPSIRSYILALIAVCTSTMLLESVKVFWSLYGIPAFTLPYNIVSLVFIYVLALIHYPYVATVIKATPEETLDYYLANIRRYPGSVRTLSLPFSGEWTVWQGFDDEWTHQDIWKYAYDFLITDEKGKTHANGGTVLSDYYAFRKPVLAPVRGRIHHVVDTLADNPIGQVDLNNRWGNLVIIYDERGYFVELSHFSEKSITVKPGDWVERGEFLGMCGNSGYSPQPHIHVQVQGTETVGSYTWPFSFISYRAGGRFFANDVPAKNAVVEPLYPDKRLDIQTAFMLEDRYVYGICENGRETGRLTLVVRAAPDGTFYFDSGEGKLFFGKHEGTFYLYHVEGNDPYLKSIFLALPRLPLVSRDHLKWREHLPISVASGGAKKILAQLLSAFYHKAASPTTELAFETKNTIRGRMSNGVFTPVVETFVELDDAVGFKTIRINDTLLRRMEDEAIRG